MRKSSGFPIRGRVAFDATITLPPTPSPFYGEGDKGGEVVLPKVCRSGHTKGREIAKAQFGIGIF